MSDTCHLLLAFIKTGSCSFVAHDFHEHRTLGLGFPARELKKKNYALFTRDVNAKKVLFEICFCANDYVDQQRHEGLVSNLQWLPLMLNTRHLRVFYLSMQHPMKHRVFTDPNYKSFQASDKDFIRFTNNYQMFFQGFGT